MQIRCPSLKPVLQRAADRVFFRSDCFVRDDGLGTSEGETYLCGDLRSAWRGMHSPIEPDAVEHDPDWILGSGQVPVISAANVIGPAAFAMASTGQV